MPSPSQRERCLPPGLNVVVTGGAGYLGSVVTARLLKAGHRVTVFDKLVYGGLSLLPFQGEPSFRLIHGDVRRAENFAQVCDGADGVVHLAAVVGEDACRIDEAHAREVNFEGTVAAIQAAQRAGVRAFVFASTCSSYGISSPGTLADENSNLRPLSEYARSKVAAENVVIDANGAMATVVFRFATLCGLSARMRFDLLVNDLARSVARGEPLEIFAPAAWRPFLHIRDAAIHIQAALEAGPVREILAGTISNVVGENYQKSSLVDLVRRHFPGAVINSTDRKPDLRDYRVSSQRIRELAGLKPTLTVEDAFLEVANAVSMGIFTEPFCPEFSAVPTDRDRLLRP